MSQGTAQTTATVLARQIYAEGVKLVAAGHDPMSLKRGIDKAVEAITGELKNLSKATKDPKEIAQVGTIAANNDSTIGDLIAEAMDKVGKEGVITVEEAKGLETTLDVVEGMQFDRGYLSPYFVTDPERMECVLQDAYLLINEKKISNMKELADPSRRQSGFLYHHCRRHQQRSHAGNKIRNTLHCVAVKARGSATAAKPCSKMCDSYRRTYTEGQIKLENITYRISAVPRDRSRQRQHDNCRRRRQEVRSGRCIKQIRAQIDETTSDYDREKLQSVSPS
jgi:chaperonin GroEL